MQTSGVTSARPPDASLFRFVHEGKAYQLKVHAKGQPLLLGKEQQAKLITLVFEQIQQSNITNLKSPVRLTEKHVIQEQQKSPINASILRRMEQVIQISAPSSLKSQEILDKPVAEKIKHLFLQESHDYMVLFFDKLKEKVTPEITTQLDQLKEQTLKSLVEDIYKGHEEWLTKDIPQATAERLWSTKEEGSRQKEASQLLNRAMYQALDLAEGHLTRTKNPSLESLHRTICAEIAQTRAQEVTDPKTNKIDIRHQFNVAIDHQKEQPLQVHMHTAQLGDKITSSLDKRVPAADGKVYGVNMHTEKVTFQGAAGTCLSSTQLRSGSFDFNDVEPTPQQVAQLTPVLDKTFLDTQVEALKNMSKKELNKHIQTIRLTEDPAAYHILIESLKLYKSQEKGWTARLEKYEGELKNFVRDRTIIETNKTCLTQVFEQVERLTDPEQKLGLSLPKEVTSMLDKDEELKTASQKWGMISLQTPVNILAGKGLNQWVVEQSKNPRLPGFIRGGLKQIAEKDISELDPIYREMQAYKQASAEKESITQGLYFNIPTNFMGSKQSLVNLGPFHLKMRLSGKFMSGLIDRMRGQKVKEETLASTQTVYRLALKAQALVDNQLEKPTLDPETRAVLARYAKSLTDLIDQTFEKNSHQADAVQLRHVPGVDAQYETVGRLTILMQMLNFNTTGHCRSGNNRTAAWLAKSHQIVGVMAASTDGSLPTPKELAGQLARSQVGKMVQKKLPKGLVQNLQNHWSLDIFLKSFQTSLTLQQVNKGTQGTKLNVMEITNPHYRRAVQKGAFDLAGKFEERYLQQVRLKSL